MDIYSHWKLKRDLQADTIMKPFTAEEIQEMTARAREQFAKIKPK